MLSEGERHYLQTGEKLEGGEPTKSHRNTIESRVRDKVLRAVRDLRIVHDNEYIHDAYIDDAFSDLGRLVVGADDFEFLDDDEPLDLEANDDV